MSDLALLGSRPRETDNTQMQQQAQASLLLPKRVSTQGRQLLALHNFARQELGQNTPGRREALALVPDPRSGSQELRPTGESPWFLGVRCLLGRGQAPRGKSQKSH